MRNYFVNMVFEDIVAELCRIDLDPANQDLNQLGQKMILITCMIVCPGHIGPIESTQAITEDHLQLAHDIMLTSDF